MLKPILTTDGTEPLSGTNHVGCHPGTHVARSSRHIFLTRRHEDRKIPRGAFFVPSPIGFVASCDAFIRGPHKLCGGGCHLWLKCLVQLVVSCCLIAGACRPLCSLCLCGKNRNQRLICVPQWHTFLACLRH
jgi:hypothetical protein